MQEAAIAAGKDEVEQKLKQEWGHEYDKNLKAAMRAISVYGDNDLNELLNTEVGNHPALVKLFARLGAEVTEDMAQNTTNNTLAVSPLDAQTEIDRIMKDNNHPYFKPNHKDHSAAVEQMRQLYEKRYGNK